VNDFTFFLTEGGKNHNIFVMNETDETLEQSTEENAILQAIAELSKKIDGLEGKFGTSEENNKTQFEAINAQFEAINAQFEAIREGIVFNNTRFDRLSAEVYEARADIARLRVSFSEFTEEIRQSQKSLV
jgi:chromosome segregation ATPase